MAVLGLLKDVRSQTGTKDSRAVSMTVKDIPVGDIRIKENVRSEYNGIDELASNILQFGLQQPITVYSDGEEYIVKTGHRRFKAYELLYTKEPDRFHSIRCVVSDENNIAIIQLIENVQRQNLTDKELFDALLALRLQKVTHKEIANIMGKSLQWVDKTFTYINEICENPKLLEYTSAGGSIQDIAETAGLTVAQRIKVLEKRKNGTLQNRKELREEVKKWKKLSDDANAPSSPEVDHDFDYQRIKKVLQRFVAEGTILPASGKPNVMRKEIPHELKIELRTENKASYEILSKGLEALFKVLHLQSVFDLELKREACRNCYR